MPENTVAKAHRDSSPEATGCIREGKSQLEASHDVGDEVGEDHTQAVSYTHLTLPTIYSV